jgi:hypothetical protein
LKQASFFGQVPILPEQYEIEKEIRLWRAVLDQALEDILNDKFGPHTEQNKEAARLWVLECDEDFEEVCELACLEPPKVQRKLRELTGV